jgi:HEPN domain-containing protein
MDSPKLLEVRSWLVKANQDLLASAWLLRSPQSLYGAVGFHSQQAGEKALKAYLTWQEEPFEKIHSLVALVGICLKFSDEFESLRAAAATLTPYAVTTRYPGDLPDISYQEAQEAYSFASVILEFIKSRLPKEALIS